MLRLLSDPALDGPTNMARDEALLTRVGEGESQRTLRLYQWNPPTISLGYFQHYADYEALAPPAGDLPVVRRQTGGGAILHDLELTYSLALRLGDPLLRRGPNHLYELAHEAVIAALAELEAAAKPAGFTDDSGAARGPFFCFARRHKFDVLIGGDKLAGSAQRRTKTATLQHGSVVLGNRFGQQSTATVDLPFDEAITRLRSLFVTHFAKVTAEAIESGRWEAAELALAEELASKYQGDEWTKRR